MMGRICKERLDIMEVTRPFEPFQQGYVSMQGDENRRIIWYLSAQQHPRRAHITFKLPADIQGMIYDIHLMTEGKGLLVQQLCVSHQGEDDTVGEHPQA